MCVVVVVGVVVVVKVVTIKVVSCFLSFFTERGINIKRIRRSRRRYR